MIYMYSEVPDPLQEREESCTAAPDYIRGSICC